MACVKMADPSSLKGELTRLIPPRLPAQWPGNPMEVTGISGRDDSTDFNLNSAVPSREHSGLEFWMDRAISELDRARHDLHADAIHDLRVALRRCIAMAGVYKALDPFPAWQEMRQTARNLFKRLGELRDVQVMKEWAEKLANEKDPAGLKLSTALNSRESQLFAGAEESIREFNRKRWLRLRDQLGRRSFLVSPGEEVFLQFALEHWHDAHEMHRQALRNRSRASYHKLRIAIKKFRYIVENFLPDQHKLWAAELKELQESLGEFHDLFILWRTALGIGALADRDLRSKWRGRIEAESRMRLLAYRSKMVGKESLWPIWRSGLPRDLELKKAAESRIRTWASCHDPDFARTCVMERLASQIFDGLCSTEHVAPDRKTEIISALHVAAVMYSIGVQKERKRSGKAAYKLASRTRPPLGFPAQAYTIAALAARCRQGAIHKLKSAPLRSLSLHQVEDLKLISAILHMADLLAEMPGRPDGNLEVVQGDRGLFLYVAGYDPNSALARKLAAARHPLEIACKAPILIRPLQEKS